MGVCFICGTATDSVEQFVSEMAGTIFDLCHDCSCQFQRRMYVRQMEIKRLKTIGRI